MIFTGIYNVSVYTLTVYNKQWRFLPFILLQPPAPPHTHYLPAWTSGSATALTTAGDERRLKKQCTPTYPAMMNVPQIVEIILFN